MTGHIEERGRENLGTDLVVRLSVREWFDVTEGHCPDPAAVQCYATGYEGKRNGSTIWFLTRYEDEGDRFALVCHMRGEARRVAMGMIELGWLWEQIGGAEVP